MLRSDEYLTDKLVHFEPNMHGIIYKIVLKLKTERFERVYDTIVDHVENTHDGLFRIIFDSDRGHDDIRIQDIERLSIN